MLSAMMNLASPAAGRRPPRSGQIGFTLIELTIVMVVAGLLLVPLIRMAGSAVITSRGERTQIALEAASEALISFAAVHGGCLPFASDDEGGLIDTDTGGSVAASPDTGARGTNQNAGDLPWADLGLTNAFLDGDGLRIQYYVATPYTDSDANAAIITCEAGFKGFQWDSSVNYVASADNPLWVFDHDPASGVRTLYEIKKGFSLAAGIHPFDGGAAVDQSIEQLPTPLLEVRRGPDVVGAAPQDDVISLQNVFILIAPGKKRNVSLSNLYVRDSTHTSAGGSSWSYGVSDVDDHLFSMETNVGATDSFNDGDDTLLIMSFNQFKAEMGKHGINMEPVCENPC